MHSVLTRQSRNYLPLTIAMMTFLILLINVSFKIIELDGLIFSVNSVLCPIIAGLYLWILKVCNPLQQRQILNQSLLALYLFSIGVYLLVNLPSAENMRDNIAYQIVFEDIPRKFFASTLSFGLSFYLPHLYCCSQKKEVLGSSKKQVLLALVGGFCFFAIDFLLLFSDPQARSFFRIFLDSSMVAAVILLSMGVLYLTFSVSEKWVDRSVPRKISLYFLNPLYHYLVGFSVIILLICLSCEYRLITFGNEGMLAASSVLLPLVFIASNLVGELYGYKANLRLTAVLLLAELVFDFLLMMAVLLPSPQFFDLNPFYTIIMPRRIPAATLALSLAFVSNAFLLEKLKNSIYREHRALRIILANTIAHSILCLVNYTILFTGVFPYEQIFNIAISSWTYKFIVTLISLPFILWLYNTMEKQPLTLPNI